MQKINVQLDIFGNWKTLDFINQLECKTKVAFIDACYSGNIEIESKTIETYDWNNIINCGCSIFASCTANQSSYEYQEEKCSVFTACLVAALKNKIVQQKGVITVDDIQKLVNRYMTNLTLKTGNKQNLIFMSNAVGTIYFRNLEPIKVSNKVYIEQDKYIIHEIKELKQIPIKKYAVKIQLKEIMDYEEICEVINNAKKYVKELRTSNLIFFYIAEDYDDIVSCNFMCDITWCDENQDKAWWYRIGKNEFILDNKCIHVNSFHEDIKRNIKDNTISDQEMIELLNRTLRECINNAEIIKNLFIEHRNKLITEDELFAKSQSANERINELFLTTSDFKFPSNDLKSYDDACNNLFATIHNMSNVYNYKYKEKRNTENRILVMEDFIDMYNKDLQSVKKYLE